MKRDFYHWVNDQCSSFKLMNLVFIPLGIILSIVLCVIFLYNPPSEKDYTELAQKQSIFISDFKKVYDLDNVEIYVHEDEISVKLSKSNCALISHFDKDKTYMYSEKIDLNAPLPVIIFLGTGVGIGGGMLLFVIFLIICVIISHIMKRKSVKEYH